MLRSIPPLLLLLAAGSAAAQTPTPQPPVSPQLAGDRQLVAQCLRDSAGMPQSCVGVVAVSCVRAAQGTRGEAERACAKREEVVWRERLSLVSQAVLRATDQSVRARFVALQVSWESYVAQKCGFYGSVQAPSREAGLRAGCELKEVAERSIELERLVQRGTQPRRPSGPPQIIR